MELKTADLCDTHSDHLQIASPGLHDYGGKPRFYGRVVTLKVFEDNSLVRELLARDGRDQVLVIDGGGSLRCALLGDLLAAKAVKNGWSGIIVNGCIRDSADIAAMPLGVKALATHPLKSVKKGVGDIDLPVTFAGVTFHPGDYVYADEDGVIVSAAPLLGTA
ncbi:MAG: ribonuclease E activity regulator RraA [Thiotrichales bacterium]